MRAEIPAVFLATFAVLAGVAAAPGDSVGGPRLTVGDAWTYHTNTSLETGFFFDGQVTLTVADEGPVTVEGVTYDGVRTSLAGAGTAAGIVVTQIGSTPASGDWTLAGQETLEAAGLKPIANVLDLEANGTLHTQPVSIPFRLRVQNTTTYRRWDDAWQFPLEVGNSTVVASEMNFSEDVSLFYGFPTTPVHTAGRVWWNVTYALVTQVAIDVPAGHFDAYRIQEVFPDGSVNLLDYAPTVGNYARTEAYNGTSEIARTELVSYRYQALEPDRFFGLTAVQWGIVGGFTIAIGSIAAVWWIRNRRGAPPQVPPPPPPT